MILQYIRRSSLACLMYIFVEIFYHAFRSPQAALLRIFSMSSNVDSSCSELSVNRVFGSWFGVSSNLTLRLISCDGTAGTWRLI